MFFECVRSKNHKLLAITSARRISDGYFAMVQDENNSIKEIFYSEFTNYPPPSFYREPQYLTEVNKELVYLID